MDLSWGLNYLLVNFGGNNVAGGDEVYGYEFNFDLGNSILCRQMKS